MASRVLLISTNRSDQPYPVFPLGLAHVETALRKAGHITRCVDLQSDREPVENIVAEFQPDFVGLSLRNIDDIEIDRQETYFEDVAPLCRKIRETRKCPIVLGGSAFSIFPERLLELAGADFGIHGEGEVSFLQLIETAAAGADCSGIPGLVYRRNGRVVVNPRQELAGDAIEPPHRPQAWVDHYLQHSLMLNLQTQRGCPLDCIYCTYPVIQGKTLRLRSVDSVVAELEAITRQGARHVFIADSVFNVSEAHVVNVCEAILRHGIKIEWTCFLRPKGLTVDLMRLMARAGLTHVEFGADSFCDPVLESYGKKFMFEDIFESSELARRERVHYCHFLICGGPGETRATLETSFENSLRLKNAVIMPLIGMRVYPGTPLHDRALREGRIPAGTDLLKPFFYLAPPLTVNELDALLRGFKRKSSGWIVGALPPTFKPLAEGLRKRGVLGPLWEYYEPLQRLT